MLSPILLVKKTSNKKTGPMAVTIANAPGTCPSECPFFNAGCYAQQGPSGIHSIRAKQAANDLGAFIRDLPHAGKIRHFVSGDLMLDDEVNVPLINEMVSAHADRPDVKGYGYTHAHKRPEISAQHLNSAESLTYNASCESDEEVETALKQGWPVVRVVAKDTPKVVEMPMYLQVVCPATYKDDVSCDKCMLCAKKDRKRRDGKPVVVAFPVHGAQSAKAAANVLAKQVAA